MADAHLLLSLACLGAETSDRGAFLSSLSVCLWEELAEALRGLRLQLVGQVVEDADTVLHRLKEKQQHVHLYISSFTNSILKGLL